jgi:hypothetical protein
MTSAFTNGLECIAVKPRFGKGRHDGGVGGGKADIATKSRHCGEEVGGEGLIISGTKSEHKKVRQFPLAVVFHLNGPHATVLQMEATSHAPVRHIPKS